MTTVLPLASAIPPESMLPSPVLIVEDQRAMQLRLHGILRALGFEEEALFFADSIAAARSLLAEHPFAMALVDLGLPDGHGRDLIRHLHQQDAALPILVISAWSSDQVIVDALQAGAGGYLLKEREDVEIALSIRSALRGGAPIDPFVAKRILELVAIGEPAQGAHAPGASSPPAAPALSKREIEILGLVAKGLTNREIASVLSLSRFTAECHIRNIYKKLAVNSRTQAVFEARTFGLLS